ncbi:MAG: SIS domain-containing protein [Candidatus Altiarchaeota archaeon]|nr:SIS domain-containing protein [Candidatus Altiarchaeota archaeon]
MEIDIGKHDSLDMHSHISMQGLAVRETLSRNRVKTKKLAAELDFDKLVVNGAGDKYIVPLIASHFWRAYATKPIEIIHSRTLADNPPKYIDKKTLVVFVSQSGKTTDTMDAARAVAQTGASMLTITNLREKEENSLWFIKDQGGSVLKTYTPIYPEKALPSTMTFHASLALLYQLFSELAGFSIQTELAQLTGIVDKLSKDQTLEHKMIELAMDSLRLGNRTKYVLGDGPRYGLARKLSMIMLMEGAKENAAPIETEEFTHSLIETLDTQNPRKLDTIVFMPPDDAVSRHSAEKMCKTWSKFAQVTQFEPPRVCTNHKLNNLLSPQAQMVQAEWFSYYKAVLKGIDPGVGHMVKKVRSGSW